MRYGCRFFLPKKRVFLPKLSVFLRKHSELIGIISELMGISSRNDVFCMNKDCFLPQNRAFFRFISSELIGISSELMQQRKVNIYIYLLLHPRVRTCVRERKFSRKYFGKRNRLYLQEKREKKKLRQKEKSKKKTPQMSVEFPVSFSWLHEKGQNPFPFCLW